jgi:hypothetical protein
VNESDTRFLTRMSPRQALADSERASSHHFRQRYSDVWANFGPAVGPASSVSAILRHAKFGILVDRSGYRDEALSDLHHHYLIFNP